MIRSILAILGGFIAGILVIALVEFLDYKMYGPAELLDYTNKDTMRHFITNLPFLALLILCFAVFLGSIVGGFVASQINFESGETNSIIVGVLLLITVVAYLLQIPHPMWFWLVCLVTCVPLSYLGYFIDSSYLYKDTID